ncbi:type II toxin-antitoxin system RelE/ParE family toxin, partial [Streptococcus suis]
MYHLEYSKKAQKQIKKLDKQIQRLLFGWIDKHLEGT